ncbi:MAG: hypothetical protein CMJ24_10990 [Phycisphaerae bacterium]|nr:hypothetical protein [Phycisphaerae bacterium]
MRRCILILSLAIVVGVSTWVVGTLLTALIITPWHPDGDYSYWHVDYDGWLGMIRFWWHEPAYWLNVGVLVPMIVGSQVLFLLPIVPMRMSPGRPSSLTSSIFIAGFVAGILTLGLAMGMISLVQLIGGGLDSSSLSVFPYVGPYGAAFLDADAWESAEYLIPVSFLVVSWLLWCIPISRFLRRGQPLDRFGRLTGLLFAGTLLELLLLIPLEAMVRRRADCYCGTGSFQALVGAVLAAIWLLGPGIFLLLARRHPAWWKTHCQRCGYTRARGAASRCSECGWNWSE